jgi:hypothetical protein
MMWGQMLKAEIQKKVILLDREAAKQVSHFATLAP